VDTGLKKPSIVRLCLPPLFGYCFGSFNRVKVVWCFTLCMSESCLQRAAAETDTVSRISTPETSKKETAFGHKSTSKSLKKHLLTN